MPDAGRRMPDAGRRTPDAGCRTPDVGCRMSDVGCREWSRRSDSNRRPADYESAALPTELRRPAGGTRRARARLTRQRVPFGTNDEYSMRPLPRRLRHGPSTGPWGQTPPEAGCRTPDVGPRQRPGTAGCRTPDAGRRSPDAGRRTSDAGFRRACAPVPAAHVEHGDDPGDGRTVPTMRRSTTTTAASATSVTNTCWISKGTSVQFSSVVSLQSSVFSYQLSAISWRPASGFRRATCDVRRHETSTEN